jgi:hypothetical protein
VPTEPEFDYCQPSRDALAGIYVEVTDSARGTPAAELPAKQDRLVVSNQVQQLFGLTVSVDDRAAE